ncbi:MAG: hypothetical protein M1822_007338 [Bathelium mastoideum]|nr:MAG: hypothetical protein M1822_007338 [Bathelium mastoideum]
MPSNAERDSSTPHQERASRFPFLFSADGIEVGANTRLQFTYMQELYDTVALPKADRKAFVECEYDAFFEANALSFAKLAPAVQELWFIIQGKDPEYFDDGFDTDEEDFYESDVDLDEEILALKGHIYRQLWRDNGDWLFEMAKKPHTKRWDFKGAGRADGWRVVGRYEEDDDKRTAWEQNTRDRWRYMLC